VFTGFSMAGFGMTEYYRTHRGERWRLRLAISLTGGIVSACVVLIFAVVKFSEGAWLVIVLFPLLWLVLVRLNKRYRDEARSLDLVSWIRQDQADAPHYARHTVLVLVDRLDLAVLRALRYAGSLRPTSVQAVHFMLDNRVADELQLHWIERGLGDRVPLTMVECADRRLVRGVAQFALNTVVGDRAEVTVLLPRRTFGRFSQRILHDRTADRIAEAVGRIPHVAATIVPFDTTLPHEQVEQLEARQQEVARSAELRDVCVRRDEQPLPAALDGVTPIGAATWKRRVTVEGRVKSVQVGTLGGRSLEAQVFDPSGGIRLLFYGRTHIAGIEPGAVVRATGRVGEYKGHLALANPVYDLLATSTRQPR
jgi:hypothetical protein